MKVHIVKVMVFPVVMCGCDSWTTEKAECQRINTSELWCWRRLLRVPWTAKRLNQLILKEINPEYSLAGLVMKLKLQYSNTWCKEPTHWKQPCLWERLKAKGEGWQKMRWLGTITDLIDVNLSRLWETLEDRGAWCAVVHGLAMSQTWLSDWTTTKTW